MDFLTDTERKNVAQREAVAHELACGKTYDEIKHKLGVSTNTISLVKRIMAERGYEIIRL